MNRLLKLVLLLALCAPVLASAQWRGGAGGFVGVGTSLPGTCTVSQLYFKTDATAGQNIYMCSASNTWTQQLNSGAGGASIALDNLASVNVNLALLPQTSLDLGSTAKPWRDLFLYGAGTYGTNYFRFTGTPTAARTITLSDASGTVAFTNVATLSSLTSIGTIGTGTWQGTAIDNTRGGTGSAFFNVSGPASTVKTFAFPNASATVLTDNAAVSTAQGGTGLGAQSDDTMLVSNGTIWQAKAIPDCQDTGTNHLNYVASTNTIACGTAGGAGSGDVTAASTFGTDNRAVRSDGTGKGVQSSGITIDDSNNVTGAANVELTTGSYLGTAHTAANTLRIGAWDVDGAAFTAFITCTAGNTPTCDLSSAVTYGGGPIAQFTDPNTDALLYWRDSDGTMQPVTIGTGLSLTTGTLANTGLTTAAIDTSAELKAILTDETGSGGAVVFATGPTIDSIVLTTKANFPRVTAFPGAPSTGDVVVVTDDSTAGACDSAAGAALSLCMWNGSAWVKLGDGTSAGGALSSTDIDTSAELRAILTDESGTGAAIFAGGNIGAGTATTASANDSTTLIATTAYVQAELTAYASDTVTFTNKTTDCAGTGNVCKSKSYIHLKRPHLCDGTGATIGTTATTYGYGAGAYSNSADQAANYCEYSFEVPADLDTAVDPRLKVKFLLGNADTGTHRYVASSVSVADSAVLTGSTLANAINLDFAGDASGANGDAETVGYTTATSWGAALTAGQTWRIRLARDGDATQDNSTVNSTVIDFVIEYGVSQ